MRTSAIATLRPLAAAFALAALLPLPAAARDFVQDQGGMFSASTIAQLNQRLSNFNAQTGKEVVVVTVPSLNGATLPDAASSAFSSQSVNGVLIFIAKSDRRDIIVPDRAGSRWFTADVTRGIRQAMEAQFRTENYDAGITAAVDGVLNVYRAHMGSLQSQSNAGYSGSGTAATQSGNGGFHLSMFWWIIIAVVGFMVLRSIMRSMSGPRYYGGAPGAGAPGPMPGYGGGYGYGGGGGSFWSGMLGGLGGAWLGNEIFGQHAGGGMVAPADASQMAQGDTSGWQSDAGQADMGGASSGDWSGGGFGDSGGGFGGGDFGGGGGDSGGGW